jgi:hypothetical protein
LLGVKKIKIFILLSSKCAGSSALQYYLEKNYDIKTILHTQHFEKETLYWTKVASVLGYPQQRMHRSEVPIKPDAALQSLTDFLSRNNVVLQERNVTKYFFFEAFYSVACNAGTSVIEKSPHHLFNESNLSLIFEFSKYIADRADVVLIGLVRNPMDTVYSAWKRWNFNTVKFEREWLQSYLNLKQIADERNVSLELLLYEQIVKDPSYLEQLMVNHGFNKLRDSYKLEARSLGKWMLDNSFHHHLTNDTMKLARTLGYPEESIQQRRKENTAWHMRQVLGDFKFFLSNLRRQIFKK